MSEVFSLTAENFSTKFCNEIRFMSYNVQKDKSQLNSKQKL